MKKVFFVICSIFLVVLIKFYIAEYDITYEVNNIKVVEKGTKNYISVEVIYENESYNYVFFNGRKLSKKLVSEIKIQEVNGHICVEPVISKIDSYSICSKEGNMVSYQIASGNIDIPDIKEDFSYNKNLNNDEYILIWKYDGFYYLNGKAYKSINIFDKDRYSNDLMFMLNGYIIFPKYDNDYLFSDFIILDAVSGNYRVVSSKYKISYDSYIVGNNKNSIYIFDNKDIKLYEVNYKKNNVKLIGDSEKGFIKYENGKKKKADSSEYTKEKITFFNAINEQISIEKNVLTYDINKNIKLKFFDKEDIHVINVFEDNIYFIYKDNLYRYNNSGINFIVHNFEFNFNYENNVFVYKR